MKDKNLHGHHTNLLELDLPSSSSSSNPFLTPSVEGGAFPNLFSHSHSVFCPSSSSSSSFMGLSEIYPSTGHPLVNSNGGTSEKKRKMESKSGGMEKLRTTPKEVIHVRAKRGQATDSHSLAERVRRERINDKLKVLQDIVPGCYKTMGMAVMLDVIINYVRNLQNQIEFLSMKLSAASMFYDFNSPEAEAMEAFQKTNPCEARELERIMIDEGFIYQSGLVSSQCDPPLPPPPHTCPF